MTADEVPCPALARKLLTRFVCSLRNTVRFRRAVKTAVKLRSATMIERYRDHAANERTYLAWVRTGITVMVLGFIVEKFELFLASLSGLLANQDHQVMQGHGPEYVSLALVLLGVLVIVAGAIRFFQIRTQIESAGGMQFSGTLLALVLTVSLVVFGIYILLYLVRII